MKVKKLLARNSVFVYALTICFSMFHYAESKAASVHLEFSNGWEADFDADVSQSNLLIRDNTTISGEAPRLTQYSTEKNYTSINNSQILIVDQFYQKWHHNTSYTHCYGGWFRRSCHTHYAGHYDYLNNYNKLFTNFDLTNFDTIIDKLVATLNVENLYFAQNYKDSVWHGGGQHRNERTTLTTILVDGMNVAQVPTPSIIILMTIGLIGLARRSYPYAES